MLKYNYKIQKHIYFKKERVMCLKNREELIFEISKNFMRSGRELYAAMDRTLIATGMLTKKEVYKYLIQIDLKNASDYKLFLLDNLIYEVFDRLNPLYYFDKEEIDDFKIISRSNKNGVPLTFDNTEIISKDGDLLVVASVDEIILMLANNVICTRWNIENDMITVIQENVDTFYRDVEKTTNCNKIKLSIKNKNFHPSPIRVFAEDFLCVCTKNKSNRKFSIIKGSLVLTSGIEQIVALKKMYEDGFLLEEYKVPMIVSFGDICDLRKTDVEKIITQDNAEIYLSNNEINRKANEYFENIFFEMRTSRNIPKEIDISSFKNSTERFIPKDIFIDSIRTYFKFCSNADEKQIKKVSFFIIEFYNVVISTFWNDFHPVQETEERKKWVTNYNFLCGILYIAARIYKHKGTFMDWKDILKDMLLKMNLDRDKISLTELQIEIKNIGNKIGAMFSGKNL